MERFNEDMESNITAWSKMKMSAMNAGYKEGANFARDSVFQNGFDTGFEQGIKMGYCLGIFQGLESAKASQSSQTSFDDYKPIRGCCQICVDKELLKSSVEHVNKVQMKYNETVKTKLKHQNSESTKLFVDNLSSLLN